ncbi:enoyl-CoA hydratase-related protein [Mesorhizobium amorphae]|uniref:Enoyl-CoA hydratase n=1 Tax=Mesorhizobium amorphae CCNWGS0123 TaxID=1082933 RepID=G6YIM3_9HYPH|nr:enoyl-CoA hydratase-related protein [Mesorhizobium amorphae]ANT52995.1 2,3-dehydroadipyl-CoA hydratase [Mesorhizobium amorphae CCNWGS0123]EHH05905.1 enoyl-CoA hydratase [Mesorhizobium amorphae CCNWGS0123]GLR40868.1 enoyl-CoA hydratase [Mesorhizobium amorphae]
MMDRLVQAVEPAPGIRLLTLNRPDKLNALSKALLGELSQLLAGFEADTEVGCVVLTGAGRAFAAGADISDMLERGVASYTDPERLACWRAIEGFSKPIIAAVNGYALGGGLELALLCDIIIASQTAQFATPEIKIGSFPGDGGTQRLPRLVGKSFAMQMVLTGDMVDATLAERKGLVSEVVAADRLLPRALEIAAAISAKSVAITPYAKKAVQAAFETELQSGLEIEHRLTVEAFGKEDRIEGLRAFAEKRAPAFRGK